ARCVGKKMTPKDFSVFGAKLIAGIDRIPDTVMDRSITLLLQRKRYGEEVSRWRYKHFTHDVKPIRDAYSLWARDAADIAAMEIDVIEELNDRGFDVWEPLLAIAQAAGGDWFQRARAAAIILSGGEREVEDYGVQLLSAIRDIFNATKLEQMLTVALLRHLIERDSEPWAGWWGKEVDMAKDGETPRKPTNDLAKHLK